MSKRDGVLLTWLAYNHDPFEREQDTDEYRKTRDGRHIPGPTLVFLFDDDSPFKGSVDRVVMLAQKDDVSRRRVDETFRAIREQDTTIECEPILWDGEDPTDHETIFKLLHKEIPRIQERHAGKKLLVHTSPGTPSMQTIWILMGETGFIRPPFQLLKSLRPGQRRGGPAVKPIQLGIETFYKQYRRTRPLEISSRSEAIFWDRAQFRSDALKKLYAEAERVASLRVPVLILGERGTGKTTLASWIRLNSPFRRKELDDGWPAVACGQYQPSTMRAELFGYVAGAFTDAKKDQQGLLARADGDTVFLDEVGDLTRDMQRLLIKAVEERRFQPIGSPTWTKSTFRLLTATNVPLRELQERLNPDFFDRVALVRLRTPPLREIRDDLPWLWQEVFRHVIREGAVDFAFPERLHSVILDFLQGHPLPGNLRDLYAIAWRLLARWNGESLPSDSAFRDWLPTALDAPHLRDTGVLARDVASRFAEDASLDDILAAHSSLPTKEVERAMQSWIAKEVRRIASQQKVPPESLVDVSAKTLRDWARGDAR
jgi:DNA-binding NtrC family response regulator